jgi:hypothetical protein
VARGGTVADPVLPRPPATTRQGGERPAGGAAARRAALPAEDLARVEANLEVIDRALEEVRQALVKDPASPELNRMLVATHRKKVDVLRRVVRLSTAL